MASKTAAYIRFGNSLAEGITIGCSSLSEVVPADEQISAFCIYLRLLFFNRLWFRAENYKMPAHRRKRYVQQDMRPIQSLIFILSLALFSCKQSNPTKKLVTDDLKYSAYYWHLNEHTDSFEFYLVHYINIDNEGNYFLMRHDMWRDKPRYFKGSINDTIRKCIDTTFFKDSFKTDYTYMTNPNFIYDGFTYCLDYNTQNEKRKEILFIPPNSPDEIKTISTLLDTLIYSNKSEILDTLNISLYTKQLKELAEKVEPPPTPKMLPPPPINSKTILFKPPKSKH